MQEAQARETANSAPSNDAPAAPQSQPAQQPSTVPADPTDDEEDGYSVGHQRADDHGISEEEEEYDLSALDADHRERGGGKAEKRSYWLSKAMAGGVSDGGDD